MTTADSPEANPGPILLASPGFTAWLGAAGGSLALSTCQRGRLTSSRSTAASRSLAMNSPPRVPTPPTSSWVEVCLGTTGHGYA